MDDSEVWGILERKYQRYAAEIAQQMKAFPLDCRLSGDDSPLADVWEEFKDQVQNELSFSWHVYEYTVRSMCEGLVESLPSDEQDALWLLTDHYIHTSGEPENKHRPDLDAIEEELYQHVYELAEGEPMSGTNCEAGTSAP